MIRTCNRYPYQTISALDYIDSIILDPSYGCRTWICHSRREITPAPEPPAVEWLLPRLVAETQVRQPVPSVATRSAGLETLLITLLSGNLAPAQQPRPGSLRRDWNAVVCFSCGKAGHSATRCPTLDESFPFMLP